MCESGRVSFRTSRGQVIGQVTHGTWPPLAAALDEAVDACCATCQWCSPAGVCGHSKSAWYLDFVQSDGHCDLWRLRIVTSPDDDVAGRDDYPSWVCAVCGEKYGRHPAGVSTWHVGACGICGRVTGVTEPRDFGHLREWPVRDA